MSELGKTIKDRIDPPKLDAEDVKMILDALSDLGSSRRRSINDDRSIDDAIFEWVSSHFQCRIAQDKGDHQFEWS